MKEEKNIINITLILLTSHFFISNYSKPLFKVNEIEEGSSISLYLFRLFFYFSILAVTIVSLKRIQRAIITHKNNTIIVIVFYMFWMLIVSYITPFGSFFKLPNKYFYLFAIITLISLKYNNINVIKIVKGIFLHTQIIFYSILISYMRTMVSQPIRGFRMYRPSVFEINPNESALLMASFFPIILYIQSNYKPKVYLKIFHYFTIGIYFSALIFYNGTRSAIAISILSYVIYLIFVKRKFMFTLVVSISFLFYTGTSIQKIIKEQFLKDEIFSSEGLEIIRHGRRMQGHFASRIGGILIPLTRYTLTQRPITGFGQGGYKKIAPQVTFSYTKSGKKIVFFRAPHNFFLEALVESGFIGLFIVVIIYVEVFKKVIKMNNNKFVDIYNMHSLKISFLTGFLSFTFMCFISNAWSYRGWTILTLYIILSSCLSIKRNRKNDLFMEFNTIKE